MNGRKGARRAERGLGADGASGRGKRVSPPESLLGAAKRLCGMCGSVDVLSMRCGCLICSPCAERKASWGIRYECPRCARRGVPI